MTIGRILQFFRNSGLLGLAFFVCAVASHLLGLDRSSGFWPLVAQEASLLGMMSLGLLVLHHAGEFDFSMDAIFACSLVLTGVASTVMPVEIACLSGLAAAALIGLINGFLVIRLNVTLLLTFALGVVWRQLAQLLADGRPFTVESASTSWVSALAWQNALGLPVTFWLLLLLAAFTRLFFTGTSHGHNLVAIGLDPHKAQLLGLNVVLYKRLAFAFAGLLAGLAAVFYFGRLSTVDASAGSQMTFLALGALIVANRGLSRTRPSPFRLVVSVLLIAFLEVAISSYQGLPPVVNILLGITIVLALGLVRPQKVLAR